MALATSTYLAIAAVAVAGASSYEANQQAKAAAKKDEEAQEVSAAEQAAQQTAQTRAQIREERIRRAQILQSSENTGVTGSSGALGSIGALQTTVGTNLAAASRQAASAQAITGLQQEAADLRSKGRDVQAQGQLASSAISAGSSLFDAYDAAQAAQASQQKTQQGGYQPFVGPQQNLFQ